MLANRSSASAGMLASDLRDAYNNVISNANNNTLLVKLLGSRGLGAFTCAGSRRLPGGLRLMITAEEYVHECAYGHQGHPARAD